LKAEALPAAEIAMQVIFCRWSLVLRGKVSVARVSDLRSHDYVSIAGARLTFVAATKLGSILCENS
jgi:hypothetical protein